VDVWACSVWMVSVAGREAVCYHGFATGRLLGSGACPRAALDVMYTEESPGFGASLRRYRVAAGLSQEALAEQAGISARAISDLERDNARMPRRDTLALLIAALQLSASQRAVLDGAVRRRRGPIAAAPSTGDVLASSLPALPGPLFGRTHEVAAVTALLLRDERRLLTLTGPGGVGKTSLALQVASEQRTAFIDGVRFVDLSAIREPNLVASAAATVLRTPS
jgi:transcriptional regulator with XRE-family HTH domain